MKQILISGYLGFGNFGDEALLHVLIRDLVNIGIKRTNITVISNDYVSTISKYGVKAIDRKDFFQIIPSILMTDAIIFIGGLFQDKTSFKSFLYYYIHLFLAEITGKDIIFCGAGIGPLQRRITQILFKFGMKSASMLTVRDHVSAATVSYEKSLLVTCDPVWSLKQEFNFQDAIKQINWKLPILGVSIRSDKNLKDFHLKDLADKISKITSSMKDWQVLLIPCRPYEDLPLLYELFDLIIKRVTSPERIVLLENFNEFSIPQQAGILGSCDVMVGMRYHAILAALANEKPVFGLIYDQKVKSLLEFSEQVGASFKDDLDKPWSYFWQNLKYTSEKAKQAKEKASQLHNVNIEFLQKILT